MTPAPAPHNLTPDEAACWRLLADQQVSVSGRVDLIEDRAARIEERLNHVQQDVASLLYLVRDGNGRPSLLTLAERLSARLEDLTGTVTALKAGAAERRADRTKVTIAIVSAAGAVITALITSAVSAIVVFVG